MSNIPHNHTPDPQLIPRRLVRLVEERARDVARTVTQEQHGVGDDLLGVAGRVGDLQRQDQHKRGIVRARQEIADVAAGALRIRDEPESKRARDVGEKEEQHEAASVVVGESVVEVHAREDRADD